MEDEYCELGNLVWWVCFFFFQAEDGIRDYKVTGVQTCALPIYFEISQHVIPDFEIDRVITFLIMINNAKITFYFYNYEDIYVIQNHFHSGHSLHTTWPLLF